MLASLFAKGNRRTVAFLMELRKQAMADRAPRVAQRIQGVMLSLEKHSVPEIAALLHVHRSSVHGWIHNWNEFREEGLFEGHRSGRPAELTKEQKERLHDIVESGPVAYGLNTGVWTSNILTQVIADEFSVTYDPGHVRKLLHTIGLSVQRPTTRLVQADPKKQHAWTRYRWPNIKKKPKKKAR